MHNGPVTKMNWNGFVLATDADDLAFQRPVLPEGPKYNGFRSVSPGKRDNNLPAELNQLPCGIVLPEHVVQHAESASHFLAGRTAAEAADAFAHLHLRRLIDRGMQDNRPFSDPAEVNRTGFADQLGQRLDVLSQPLHRNGSRRETVIYVKSIFHGAIFPQA